MGVDSEQVLLTTIVGPILLRMFCTVAVIEELCMETRDGLCGIRAGWVGQRLS